MHADLHGELLPGSIFFPHSTKKALFYYHFIILYYYHIIMITGYEDEMVKKLNIFYLFSIDFQVSEAANLLKTGSQIRHKLNRKE